MPVFLVAEVGTTWNGDVEFAKELISKAKQAGADTVKFQLFSENEIEDLPMEVKDKLKPMILTDETFLELKKWGDKVKVDVFASAMNLKAVRLLKKADCKFIKIRQKDSKNEELIEAALKTGKFVLISTTSLPITPDLLFHPHIRWMYNVPFYPPRERELHLSQIVGYKGFSDHYPSISSALAATAIILDHYGKGYEFIVEKHVVPEHDSAYVDDAVSITFDEFTALTKYIRQLEQMSWEATERKLPVI